MWWRPSRISPSRWAVTSRASLLVDISPFCAKTASRASGSGHNRHGTPQRYLDNLGRHADADRHDAATEAAGDDEIAFQAEMAVGEPQAVLGRHGRRPAEQADLAAMGMAGQLQRDARGHQRCNVGLVREQDD